MTPARLIAVVGPSGVGKDSVMHGLSTARPNLRLVRRTITRTPDMGGEDYHSVTDEEFDALMNAGRFCIWWSSHGLKYGIPNDVLSDIAMGTTCLANLSRAALARASSVFPLLTVLNIVADPETLKQRLTNRGRETAADIAKRLEQGKSPIPNGLDVITLSNDGDLSDTIQRACRALDPVDE